MSRLSAGVQVSAYTDLLGAPIVKRPLPHNPLVEWIWQRPEFVVQAAVNNLGQVEMYTVTSLASTFHPPVPLVEGSSGDRLRLGVSKFDQIPIDMIEGSEGVYPASAKYHYSELLGGGGASHGRYLILTNSWDGTGAPEPAPGAIEMLSQAVSDCGLDAFGFKGCKATNSGAVSKLAGVRAGLHISGFTLTAGDFDPRMIEVNRSPWLLDSACDVPHGCK